MPNTIPESDAELEAQIRAWVKAGNAVQIGRLKKSRRGPLPHKFNYDGPIIEEPRRGAPATTKGSKHG